MLRDQKGLSMVELAITIAIMGLLVVGTLTGTNLVRSAKLRKLVTEFTKYQTAIDEFIEEYQYLPGDMANAYSFWGSSCGTDDANSVGSCNGNGDGAIEFVGTTSGSPDLESTAATPQEDLIAWMHLSSSKLIPGSFTGENYDSNNRYKQKINAPISEAFPEGVFMLRTEMNNSGDTIYGTNGITLRVGKLADVSASAKKFPVGGLLSAKDAYSIDKKLDDGKASHGILYSIRTNKDSPPTSGCVDDVWTASSANYDLDDTSKTCNLVYWYNKY